MPAFDAINVIGAATVMSGVLGGSWTHIVSGSDRYLLVGISGWDDTSVITSFTVKFNGVTMTFLGGRTTSGQNNVGLWGLVAPDLGEFWIDVTTIPAGFTAVAG